MVQPSTIAYLVVYQWVCRSVQGGCQRGERGAKLLFKNRFFCFPANGEVSRERYEMRLHGASAPSLCMAGWLDGQGSGGGAGGRCGRTPCPRVLPIRLRKVDRLNRPRRLGACSATVAECIAGVPRSGTDDGAIFR